MIELSVPVLVYFLCAATSVGCAVLLLRAHRRARTKLLLWSAACFALLGASNVLLFVDLAVFPAVDLSAPRSSLSLLGIMLLVVGLIWDGS